MYSRGLSALAFTADFPPAAPKFHQRTHRVRLRNLGTTDKKSSRKIKRRKTPRVHKKTAGGKINGGNFNSAALRSADEYSGCFQHGGDETDEYMAGGRLGADQCVCRLSCGMVHYREEPIGDLFRVKPWYLLLGGAIGAFITITVIWSMAGLGPAKAAMLIVISQLAAAWLIELFGLFGMEKTDFTVRKLLGMAVAVVGIVVFQWE